MYITVASGNALETMSKCPNHSTTFCLEISKQNETHDTMFSNLVSEKKEKENLPLKNEVMCSQNMSQNMSALLSIHSLQGEKTSNLPNSSVDCHVPLPLDPK